jgi:hypothetical protein
MLIFPQNIIPRCASLAIFCILQDFQIFIGYIFFDTEKTVISALLKKNFGLKYELPYKNQLVTFKNQS